MQDNNIVTLGYLKNFTKGILKINKNVINLSDDIIVTYEDIVNGKYYPYFKDSYNPKSIISGLYISEHNILNNFVEKESLSLIFPKLMNIEITCEDVNISPCGDTIELFTIANFNLMQRFHNGEQLIKKLQCEVNPILRKQNDEDNLFSLNGHFCSIGENLTKESRKCIITASYAYKNNIKNTSIELIQKSNELSDFIFSHTTTNSLEISGDNTIISKNGGECVISVKRIYTKHYYKLDSCGNKVVEYKEENNVDDISKLCHYTNTNNSIFNRSINVISVDKQEIGANKRHCIVNVEYDGCNASLTIEQESGADFKYTYSLLFEDESTFNVKTLNNSIATTFTIKFKSTKNLIVENEFNSSIPSCELNFVKYDDWFNVELLGIDENGLVNVKFIILSNNESKISSRETEVEIYNSNDVENRIKLLIRQPKNKCLKTEYDLLVDGERYFTYDTIKRSKMVLKPLIIKHYEDGTISKENVLPKDYEIVLKGKSSDETILKCGNLIKVDFNGTHEMMPKYFDAETNYDVTLSLSAYIKDDKNFRVTDIKCFNICLKGNDIVRNEYLFETNDKTNINFDFNDLNEIKLDILSLKKKFINDELKDNIFIDFNYVEYNDNFNVVIKNNNQVIIKPNNINELNEMLTSVIILRQEESNDEIILNVTQNGKPKDIIKDINVTVTIHKDNIIEDLWFSLNSKMYVKELESDELIYVLPLSKWWLNIDSNEDVIYNGNIKLKMNKQYNFKVDDLYIANYNGEDETFNIKLNETYLIEEDDEGIDLIINI